MVWCLKNLIYFSQTGVVSATNPSTCLPHTLVVLSKNDLCVLLRCLSVLYLAASHLQVCEALKYFSHCHEHTFMLSIDILSQMPLNTNTEKSGVQVARRC